MIDAYTRIILTVIAAALCAIAGHMFVSPASAQLPVCGETEMTVCHVEVDNLLPLGVDVENKAPLDVDVVSLPPKP